MEYPQFRDYVKEIKIGKHLPDAIYIHATAISQIPIELTDVTFKISDALKIPEDAWNVIKYSKRDFKLSLLSYPDFDIDPYPALHKSFTIDLAKLSFREANYSKSANPPILHRKETFVLDDHPLIEEFRSLTKQGEDIGLYENTRSIGFKKNWEKLIRKKGYFIGEDGHLIPLFDQSLATPTDNPVDVYRHKTAIERNQLSQPMQILARHNYLDGTWSILDYGCGKGDDVRELEAHGIDVLGWDPVYYPENEIQSSDITNLGFVLNVIEDREERDKTLGRAWALTEKLLTVSVMVAGESVISQFQPYKDGVLTKLNTFQKYYAQSEVRLYIETILNETAIAVGQGIFLIFRDKLEEQEFLLERQHIRRSWQYRTRTERIIKKKELSTQAIEDNLDLFRDYWTTTLDLGRIPANSEFEFSDQIRQIAVSHKQTHTALLSYFDDSEFQTAERKRRDDLLVYFSLGLFEKRKPYNQMPEGLKRDIKAFFTSHKLAVDEATELLFSLGNPEVIYDACELAYKELGCGSMEEGHSFIFLKDLLTEINAPLRVYVGCAATLYGELEDVNLIKAHIRSGKVTFLEYDRWETPTPQLKYRIKVKLRDLEIDMFDHSANPQTLEDKNLFSLSS